MSEKVEKLLEEIKTLTVVELAELVKAIEEEFGVSAVAAAAPVAGAAGAAAAEEKTSFNVVLTSAGDQKIKVITAVKNAQLTHTDAVTHLRSNSLSIVKI